ncbi:MAG: tetratricopeptide repeat protein [Candidatus Yanofskybacteria bacterium]|nr:tetratricopeptide repeat protein [Candidatus Yanofskybacteria bacterium]
MRELLLVKITKYLVYATAFVPLIIFSQFISPFHFGKVVVFRSLVEIMAVFYFILIIKDRGYFPKKHILLTIFSLFTLIFVISTFISVNPYLSFWGSLERMGGLWSFIHYLVYFIILISIFKTREDWLRLFKIVIFVGALSAFYGFGQKTNIEFFIGSGKRERIFGTIGNAALFAGYQIIILFLALSLALSSWVSTKHRGYFFTAALINTVAVLMTAVRGSILGVGVGFLLFAFLYTISSHSRTAKKILLGLVGLAVIFVGFAFAFKTSNFVKSSGYLTRLTDFSFQTLTVQTRFWAWRAGLTGWVETPKTILFGWGPENFNVPFSKHFNPKFFRGIGSETLFDRAHNQFVEILVTMGALAFLLYIALFAVAMRLLWKRVVQNGKERAIGVGLISLITAYIIHNSFIFDTSANFIIFFTVLGFIAWLTPHLSAAGNMGLREAQPQKGAGQAPITSYQLPVTSYKLTVGQQTLLFLLLIGAAVLIYRTNITQSKANYTTTRAIVRSWSGDFDGALAKYKEALAYDIPGKYEYRHRFAQWLLEYANGKKRGEKEEAALTYAIQQVQKNADESNQDYLPYLYISRAYIILGKDDLKSPYNDEALKNSMKALEISPSFVRAYYEVAQAFLNKKDYSNAIKYFEQAVKLNPDVGLSHWYLGAILIETGDIEGGLKAVSRATELGYMLSESDTLRLINLYIKTGDLNKITFLFERLISIKPNNPQYRASLAAGYAKIGKIDEAVEQARAAAQLDKTFESEARSFVRSLGREW